MRIGTLVLDHDFRHPAVLARDALALDAMSGGRLKLGVGAGSPLSRPEYESIGIDFERRDTNRPPRRIP